jgi:hypothetical protein
MSSPFVKLAETFRTRPFPQIPSDRVFLEIDGEAIKRKLRLEERGRDRGRNDQPPTTSRQLDDIEQEVCNIIAGQLRDAEATFNNEMRSYADRLSAASLSTSTTEIDLESRNAIAAFRTEAENELLRLRSAATHFIESLQWLHDFRRENKLQQRPAHYPEVGKRFFVMEY